MVDKWHLITNVQRKEDGEIEASAFVPLDSTWFSGHFPGEPILPGIALINLAIEAIVQAAAGVKIKITELKRVRFTGPVRPGDNLLVHITGDEAAEEKKYSFKISHEDNVICSGLIVAATIK